MFKYEKWSVLAGVRFILASIVAITHMSDYTELGWLGFIRDIGAFESILGFLLISGYSISMSYAQQPAGFVGRRVLRIYPIYLVSIAATYAGFVWLKGPLPSLLAVAINVLFLNQLLTSWSFVAPAWSLALEFWLYCLAPLLMRLRKGLVRGLVFVSFASFLVYTVLRSTEHLPYYSGLKYGANLLLLSFVWLAGLLLARSSAEEKTAIRDIGLIFAGYICLSVVVQFGHRLKHHDLAVFFAHDLGILFMQGAILLFVYFIFRYAVVPAAGPVLPRSWFLRFLGDISYPLYLLHALIYMVLERFGFKSPIFYYVTAVVASGGVYWLLDIYSKRRHLLKAPSISGQLPSSLAAGVPAPAPLPLNDRPSDKP